MRAAITLLAIVLTGAYAGGQDKADAKAGGELDVGRKKAGTAEKPVDEGPRVIGQNLPQPATIVPPPPPNADKATVDAYNQAVKSNYEYVEWANAYRRRAHEWQACSSRVVFVVCIGIVVVGVWFSWLQFRDGRKMIGRQPMTEHSQTTTVMPGTPTAAAPVVGNEAAKPKEMRTAGGSDAHSLEASLAGVKVTTSVLGVVILALSLGFFYLYLQYIYPIRPVGG